MIKAVIFDFFGVVRSDPYNTWLNNHGYSREGKFLEAVERLDAGQIDSKEFRQMLSNFSGQSLEDLNSEFESSNKVDEEVIEIIKELKENYTIGLLSNAPSQYLRNILQENNLEQYFNEIVISSEVGYIKPSKEIFEIMLDRLGTDASSTIFIDDNKIHIKGGESLGIKGIVFKKAVQLREELEFLGIKV